MIGSLQRTQHPARDISRRQDADETAFLVHHWEPSDCSAREDVDRADRGLALADRMDQARHVAIDLCVEVVLLERLNQILDADDAHKLITAHHRQARDAMVAQHLLYLAHGCLGGDADQPARHNIADLQLVNQLLGLKDFGWAHQLP